MSIKPHKQSLTHSCLTACFLMILEKDNNVRYTEEKEQEITLSGSRRIHPSYVVGITTEIVKKYKNEVKVIVDNTFFTNTLKKSFNKEKNISVEHIPVNTKLIKKLLNEKRTLICHIDTHAFGDYSHTSHFVIIEGIKNNQFAIIDPWTGKRSAIGENILKKAISELKNNVKMCPLLFY